jgi:hypothetical protein
MESVVEDAVERKLIESLGDPDEGLEIPRAIREKLLLQRQAVSSGERGRPFEEVVAELGQD